MRPLPKLSLNIENSHVSKKRKLKFLGINPFPPVALSETILQLMTLNGLEIGSVFGETILSEQNTNFRDLLGLKKRGLEPKMEEP